MDKGTFSEHEQRAWTRYKEHVATCSNGPESFSDRLWEIDLQEADFEEHCFSMKMVEDEVKIKWETPCTWVGCTWRLYYCRMVETPVWEDPFTIAQRRNSS